MNNCHRNQTKIRLSASTIQIIKSLTRQVFGKQSNVWLFGSRVLPDRKGGDIDIYIEVETTDNWYDKRINFLVALKQKIGEQKIDLIVKPKGCQECICLEAKNKGINLNQLNI